MGLRKKVIIYGKKSMEEFILKEVLKSGLPLEYFVSSCFDSEDWHIFENRHYLDKDENKSREMDLEVVKQIDVRDQHEIMASLIIQCKKIPGNA